MVDETISDYEFNRDDGESFLIRQSGQSVFLFKHHNQFGYIGYVPKSVNETVWGYITFSDIQELSWESVLDEFLSDITELATFPECAGALCDELVSNSRRALEEETQQHAFTEQAEKWIAENCTLIDPAVLG